MKPKLIADNDEKAFILHIVKLDILPSWRFCVYEYE